MMLLQLFLIKVLSIQCFCIFRRTVGYHLSSPILYALLQVQKKSACNKWNNMLQIVTPTIIGLDLSGAADVISRKITQVALYNYQWDLPRH